MQPADESHTFAQSSRHFITDCTPRYNVIQFLSIKFVPEICCISRGSPIYSYYIWQDIKNLLLHEVKQQIFRSPDFENIPEKSKIEEKSTSFKSATGVFDNSVLYNYAKTFPGKIGLLLPSFIFGP